MTARRRSGVIVPLFSLASTRSWGVGEFRRSAGLCALAAVGGAVVRSDAADHRDSRARDLAVLGAHGDGARSDLHLAAATSRISRRSAAKSRLSADDRARARRRPRVVREGRAHRRCARSRRSGCGAPTRGSSARASRSAPAARARAFAAFTARRERGGSTTTRCSRRSAAARAAALVGVAESACRVATTRRSLDARRGARATRSGTASTCSGWPRSSGRRRGSDPRPLQIFGDVPFMISADSPDVWTAQHEFRFDATVGVPPDAFSETGQDWGLPPWRWEVMAENDFAWMRRRAPRSAALFDGFRLDHLVGLYRTYIRPIDPQHAPFFAPPDEPTQLALGERLVAHLPGERRRGHRGGSRHRARLRPRVAAASRRAGLQGVSLGAPTGTRRGSRSSIRRSIAEISVATTGTHDTEPLACWWETLPADERELILAIPSVQRHLGARAALRAAHADADLATRCCAASLDSASRLTIIPVQDLFGWRDRINTPAAGRRRELDVALAVAGRSAASDIRRPRRVRAQRAGRMDAAAARGARLSASCSRAFSATRPARLATTSASSAGCTGLATCMLKPAPSTFMRSAGLA